MKLVQVFCLISSLTAAIALPNPARSDLEVSERGGDGIAFLKGMIAVKSSSGDSLGFISRFKSDFGTYVADTDEDHAAIFTFSAKTHGKSFGLLLKDKTTSSKKAPFLGAVVPHGYDLEAGGGKKRGNHAGSAKGSGTVGSAPNSGPHGGGNSYNAQHGPVERSSPEARGDGGHHHHENENDIESAIWTYNAKTKEFSAVWTTSGHSQLDVTFFYDTCKPFGLVLVTDVNGYTFSNPEAFQISLHFVPKHGKKEDW